MATKTHPTEALSVLEHLVDLELAEEMLRESAEEHFHSAQLLGSTLITALRLDEAERWLLHADRLYLDHVRATDPSVEDENVHFLSALFRVELFAKRWVLTGECENLDSVTREVQTRPRGDQPQYFAAFQDWAVGVEHMIRGRFDAAARIFDRLRRSPCEPFLYSILHAECRRRTEPRNGAALLAARLRTIAMISERPRKRMLFAARAGGLCDVLELEDEARFWRDVIRKTTGCVPAAREWFLRRSEMVAAAPAGRCGVLL